ncbi:hypothetical protein M413DRAFT_449838 [Hebeloma cylindrosporum]|uniref:Uncharacterized protein n=1 Tax=Hebeloma cylindrosporum TaxID=76867 RepID=A0A0C2Y2G9_HEBCY|nr:hypothetical protein M413DRAFT_449838 [Hebeloma cylindrosporum h7]
MDAGSRKTKKPVDRTMKNGRENSREDSENSSKRGGEGATERRIVSPSYIQNAIRS